LERIENESAVLPAVRALDEKYRTVIHLFYYEDCSIADIQKITGLGENTVKSRLLRARNKLKTMLKGVYFDDDF
jgi:RNA polymerase sigma-70 factor (ECF subfamily)